MKEQEAYVQSQPVGIHQIITTEERFIGCLLGGAAGDALGAPVEFMKRKTILEQFGEDGIKDFVPAYDSFPRSRVGMHTPSTVIQAARQK